MPFPRSFTTTPIERSSTGRFEAYSCKSASEGHLPSSVQHRELALAFVTHPRRGSSRSRRDSKLRSGSLSSKPYSFVFSLESFSRMNASISGALARMRSHCSFQDAEPLFFVERDRKTAHAVQRDPALLAHLQREAALVFALELGILSP